MRPPSGTAVRRARQARIVSLRLPLGAGRAAGTCDGAHSAHTPRHAHVERGADGSGMSKKFFLNVAVISAGAINRPNAVRLPGSWQGTQHWMPCPNQDPSWDAQALHDQNVARSVSA